MHHLGLTRSALRTDHLLQTPDTFVRTPLPGAHGVEFVVHVTPRLGARFSQMTAEFAVGGSLGPPPAQRFVYIHQGELEVTFNGKTQQLSSGDYFYAPAGTEQTVRALSTSRATIIEKPYEQCPGVGTGTPEIHIGREDAVTPVLLMGDDSLRVRALMPDGPAYDFAVNTMTYNPGSALSMVEVHAMEHGLLMLEGGGIYRLGDAWYPVEAGDFIWMAPYCPQWFGAIGKQPAKYLIYKDWCRHPLGG